MARVLTICGLLIAISLHGQVLPFTVADQTWQGTNAVASGGSSFSSIGWTNFIVAGDSLSANLGGPTNTIIGYFYNTAGLVTNKSSVNGNAGRTDLTSTFSATNICWNLQLYSNYFGPGSLTMDTACSIPGQTVSASGLDGHYDTWSPPYDGSTPEINYLDTNGPAISGVPRIFLLMAFYNDSGHDTTASNTYLSSIQSIVTNQSKVGDTVIAVDGALSPSCYTAGSLNTKGLDVQMHYQLYTNHASWFNGLVSLYTNSIYYGWSNITSLYMTDLTHPLTALHNAYATNIMISVQNMHLTYAISNVFGEWWKMNDGSGNPADSSGWGNPLFLNGSTSWKTGIGTGGQSLLFSGGYAAVTNLTVNIQATNTWTINCWITNRQVGASISYRIAGTWGYPSGQAGWEFGIGTSGGGVGTLYALLSNAANTSATGGQGTATINDGAVHMLTVTCSGANGSAVPQMLFYVDGGSDAWSQTYYSNPPGPLTNSVLWIAKDVGATGELQFQGAMSDFSIYSTCLTAHQVAALYKKGVRY